MDPYVPHLKIWTESAVRESLRSLFQNLDRIDRPWVPASSLKVRTIQRSANRIVFGRSSYRPSTDFSFKNRLFYRRKWEWLIVSLWSRYDSFRFHYSPYYHKYDHKFVISSMDLAILHMKFVWLSVATITTFINRGWKLNSAYWVVKRWLIVVES